VVARRGEPCPTLRRVRGGPGRGRGAARARWRAAVASPGRGDGGAVDLEHAPGRGLAPPGDDA